MAIIEDNTIVGHVPWNISVVCDLFLRKGLRRDSIEHDNWPSSVLKGFGKGGLNAPCKLIFSGPVKKDFKRKVQSLLQKVPKIKHFATQALAVTSPIEQIQQNDTQAASSNSSASQAIVPLIQQSVLSVSSTPIIEIDDTGSSSNDESNEEEVYPKKRAHIDANEVVNLFEGWWLQVEKGILTSLDRMLLIEEKGLNDHHINFVNKAIYSCFWIAADFATRQETASQN